MPRIVERWAFDGADEKITRLGMQPLLSELKGILEGFTLRVKDQKNVNGAATLRKMIDFSFSKADHWAKTTSGDVDWLKCMVVESTRVCMGVEVQVSARSDLIIRDVVHIRRQITRGNLDVGVLILPSDSLSYLLTDRAPSFSDGKRVIDEMRADDLPLLLLAIAHDGYSREPLPKQITNLGKS